MLRRDYNDSIAPAGTSCGAILNRYKTDSANESAQHFDSYVFFPNPDCYVCDCRTTRDMRPRGRRYHRRQDPEYELLPMHL